MGQLYSEILVGDLRRIHSVITRALTVTDTAAHRYVGHDGADESERRGLSDFATCLTTVLRGHHDAEEALVFPVAQARIPSIPIDRLSRQHDELMPLLEETLHAARAGHDDPAQDAWLERPISSLGDLDKLWHEHIALEEKHFTAEAVARGWTPDQLVALRQAIQQHAANMSKPEPLVVPFILLNLDGESRTEMATEFPEIVVNQLVPHVWASEWAPMRPFLLS